MNVQRSERLASARRETMRAGGRNCDSATTRVHQRCTVQKESRVWGVRKGVRREGRMGSGVGIVEWGSEERAMDWGRGGGIERAVKALDRIAITGGGKK